MFTAISAIFGAIFSVIAKIIAVIPWWVYVCLAIFLLGGMVFHGGSCRDFMCSKTPRVKTIKWDEFNVSEVITGASIECKSGIRGRRTKSVNLAGIVAPSDERAEESRASLERLAGNFIRVPYQGRNPQKVEDGTELVKIKCEDCNGTGKTMDDCDIRCFFCQLVSDGEQCKVCNSTGKLHLSYDTIDQCQSLITKHIDNDDCKKCGEGPCLEIIQRLKDIIASNQDPKEVQCYECGGSGETYQAPLEGQLIVCLAYSAYGQCLNTEQVRLGMAKLLPDAPKEWKKFEDEAKKKELGVWKKNSRRK